MDLMNNTLLYKANFMYQKNAATSRVPPVLLCSGRVLCS